MPQLDIQTGIQTAFIITLLLGFLSLLIGANAIRSGNRLQFFRKRRDRVMQGWRMIVVAMTFGVLSFFVNHYAEPVAYRVFPPSPTVTTTSTITLTPTVSLTPTISPTPTITDTPSITNTPSIPEEIVTQFVSTITPRAEPVFSPLVFARELDENFQPIEPAEEFANPISKIVGVFTYDQMTPGAQWTAVWYRNAELVFFETLPWDGATGGFGFTTWEPTSDAWLPGFYEVQLFVGSQWISSGQFTVTGDPPTPMPTNTPTRTPPPTSTTIPTRTPVPTRTVGPTITRTSTLTPTVTRTPTITYTPRATDTRWSTLTPVTPTQRKP